MKKTLEQRLAKQTQDMIEGYPCPGCGKDVKFILTGKGAAIEKAHYIKVEPKEVTVTVKNGHRHTGYLRHKC